MEMQGGNFNGFQRSQIMKTGCRCFAWSFENPLAAYRFPVTRRTPSLAPKSSNLTSRLLVTSSLRAQKLKVLFTDIGEVDNIAVDYISHVSACDGVDLLHTGRSHLGYSALTALLLLQRQIVPKHCTALKIVSILVVTGHPGLLHS